MKNNFRHQLFGLFSLMLTIQLYGQPGYMGNKNVFQFGTSLHPNFTKFNDRLTFLAADLDLGYERVVNRKFSIGAEYRLQYYRFPMKGGQVNNFLVSGSIDNSIVEDMPLLAHHFDINFIKYASEGSIAPFGSSIVYQLGLVRSGITDKQIAIRYNLVDDGVQSPAFLDVNDFNINLVHFGMEFLNTKSLGPKLLIKYGFGVHLYYNLSMDFFDHFGIFNYYVGGLSRNTFNSSIRFNSSLSQSRAVQNYVLEGAYARMLTLNLISYKVIIELPF